MVGKPISERKRAKVIEGDASRKRADDRCSRAVGCAASGHLSGHGCQQDRNGRLKVGLPFISKTNRIRRINCASNNNLYGT